jgi:HEXXH motif-containing protein
VIAGDSLLQSDVVDACPQLDERDGLDSFCSVLYAAFDELTAVAPGFVSSIRGLLRVVVPMRRPAHGVPSASSNAMPGAIWLTDHDDPAILAEQVVHECTHSLLFLCQELDPLIDPEAHGDGWDGYLVYSPWRDDPRPVAGLLHGAAVFTRVAMFHSARLEHSQTSRRRLTALLPQLSTASELLGGVRMTDAGDALRTDLSQRIQELSALASNLESEVPQYLECSSLPHLDGTAARRQYAHRAGERRKPKAAAGASG